MALVFDRSAAHTQLMCTAAYVVTDADNVAGSCTDPIATKTKLELPDVL